MSASQFIEKNVAKPEYEIQEVVPTEIPSIWLGFQTELTSLLSAHVDAWDNSLSMPARYQMRQISDTAR